MPHRYFQPKPYAGLTLRGKFKLIVTLTALAVGFASILGAWNYRQFSRSKQLIDQTSQTLLTELEETFNDSLRLAKIQSDLILFIQTAQPQAMADIVNESKALQNNLPEAVQPLLTTFLSMAETLEIRMGSLRFNNNKVVSSGNTIIEALENSAACEAEPGCLQGVKRSGQTFRQVRTLYIAGILNGQPQDFSATQEKISLLLGTATKELLFFAGQGDRAQATYLNQFIDLFNDLEDAIVTVAAIRERVVTSEKEINDLFLTLNNKLAQITIDHNKQVRTLADQSLRLATNYVFLLFTALALVGLCCVLAFAFVAKSILAPLDSLVNLLQRFSTALRGARRLSSAEKLQFQEIHKNIINRQDEIGDVGRASQALLNHIHNISEFRRKIEMDKTCADVHQRLGKIFVQELNLTRFVLYEVDDNGPMLPVYSQPPELKDEMPDFSGNDICRAKRTGSLVHSFHDADICSACRINNVLDYFCLPLIAGGETLGIAQILLPIATSDAQKHAYQERIEEARNYIDEAMPIMQAKRYARKLEIIATHDHLTGLYNRHYLDISLPQLAARIKRRKSRIGVLLCDMDHFKKINDTYGHEAGDQALVELAGILRATVRNSDLVVRYGGEEFLILLIDIQDGEEMSVAEKIRQAVSDHPFQLPEEARQQTISIGVTDFSAETPEGMDRILHLADLALYQAKEAGRNCIVRFNRENNGTN